METWHHSLWKTTSSQYVSVESFRGWAMEASSAFSTDFFRPFVASDLSGTDPSRRLNVDMLMDTNSGPFVWRSFGLHWFLCGRRDKAAAEHQFPFKNWIPFSIRPLHGWLSDQTLFMQQTNADKGVHFKNSTDPESEVHVDNNNKIFWS